VFFNAVKNILSRETQYYTQQYQLYTKKY